MFMHVMEILFKFLDLGNAFFFILEVDKINNFNSFGRVRKGKLYMTVKEIRINKWSNVITNIMSWQLHQQRFWINNKQKFKIVESSFKSLGRKKDIFKADNAMWSSRVFSRVKRVVLRTFMATFCPFLDVSTGFWLFSIEAMRPMSMIFSFVNTHNGVPTYKERNYSIYTMQ